MEKEHFFLRDTAGNPEREKQRYLTHSCRQSQRSGIQLILPAHEASPV